MIQKLETRLPINEIKIPSEICSSKTNTLSKKKKRIIKRHEQFQLSIFKKKKPYTFYRARHDQSKSIYQFPKHPPPLLPSSLAVFYILNTKTAIEYQPAIHPN